MRDRIIEHYKTILELGWLVSDEDGFVSLELGDTKLPATIEGKRVVLPTRDQMKNTDWSNRIGFHPLRESYNLGISDVVATLRDQYVQRLNASIGYLLQELINIGYDQAGQKKLSPEQSQVLQALVKADERTVKDFKSLLKNMKSKNNAHQFINIIVRRGGEIGGKTYGRAGLIKFPFYEQLLNNAKDPINGVKFSVKDRKQLTALFEYVFPRIVEDIDYYSVGIDSRSAPFLEALIRSTIGVVDRLEEISNLYMDKVDMPTLLTFPQDRHEWLDIFDSKDMVERLAKTIPPLNNNEDGEAPKEVYREPEPKKQSKAKEPPKRTEDEPRKETKVPQPEVKSTSNIRRGPDGRMYIGSSTPTNTTLGKPSPTRQAQDRGEWDDEVDDSLARKERELRERERKLREREIEIDRLRREEERLERQDSRTRRDDRDVRRPRDSRDDRDDRYRDDRGRRPISRRDDYYDDRRDDYRDRDREPTGDIFDDNPVLRNTLRESERVNRYGRRDDGYGGRRVRDIRDNRYRPVGRDRYYR